MDDSKETQEWTTVQRQDKRRKTNNGHTSNNTSVVSKANAVKQTHTQQACKKTKEHNNKRAKTSGSHVEQGSGCVPNVDALVTCASSNMLAVDDVMADDASAAAVAHAAASAVLSAPTTDVVFPNVSSVSVGSSPCVSSSLSAPSSSSSASSSAISSPASVRSSRFSLTPRPLYSSAESSHSFL